VRTCPPRDSGSQRGCAFLVLFLRDVARWLTQDSNGRFHPRLVASRAHQGWIPRPLPGRVAGRTADGRRPVRLVMIDLSVSPGSRFRHHATHPSFALPGMRSLESARLGIPSMDYAAPHEVRGSSRQSR
jgi:hypothetical protein